LRLSKGKYGSVAEDQTVFTELKQENNRSSEHIEDPRRQYSDQRSYGDNRSYGDRRSSYGGYGSQRRNDQSSGRRKRW